METAAEPGSAAAAPLDAQEKPAALAPTEPKKPRKRGRRADPLRAPPTYLRRLANDLARETMEREEARRAANEGRPTEPLFPKQPRRMSEAEVFAAMALSPSQKRRRRTEELKKERDEKAARSAALLASVEEWRVERAAREKAAAERKASGVKLTYADWRAEVTGEHS